MSELHKAAADLLRATKMLQEAQTEFEICQYVYQRVVKREQEASHASVEG